MRKSSPVQVSAVKKNEIWEFLKLAAKNLQFRSNHKLAIYYCRPMFDYGWAFKATRNGKIIGGILAYPTKEKSVYIDSIFVNRNHRNLGIGSLLLKKLLQIADNVPIVADIKSDNIKAKNFFQKFGFSEIMQLPNYYENGSDYILILKKAKIG